MLLFASNCKSTRLTYCFPKGSLPPPSSPNNVFHTFGTLEGDTLTQQESPRCSGIKQSGTMPPGQPLHAFHSCCSKGISFQKGFSMSLPAAVGPWDCRLPCPRALPPPRGPRPLAGGQIYFLLSD